jgi:predicted ester cyclase
MAAAGAGGSIGKWEEGMNESVRRSHERAKARGMSAIDRASARDLEAMTEAATRFVHGFNDNDWDTVRDVVASGFVFHHPVGGTVEAGPEGMVSTWAGFKVLSPDSWHPIPVMIAEGDHVAVLLPTYGTFTGKGEHAPPPTGGRLDYGMVNMVRFEEGQLAEMWFGMDSLVEMQQMGVAPSGPTPKLTAAAEANLAALGRSVEIDAAIDTVAGFDDVVVVTGPPQGDPATSTRRIEIYRIDGQTVTRTYEHEMVTNPPYGGDPAVESAASRELVERWIHDVLTSHNASTVEAIVSPHALIHPTAMPCETVFHGPTGVTEWLQRQWSAFGDLAVVDHFIVAQHDIVAARWTARGTSTGPFLGLPPTRRDVAFTGVSMYRIENGQIAEIWDTRNTLGILHQLNPDIGAGGHHH